MKLAYHISGLDLKVENMMNKPLVSIGIPTYNGEKFIKKCILSVFKQSYKNIEIIISDDSSTDKTLKILEDFKKDKQISIFTHKERIGVQNNWNFCLKQAKGKYIKILCQDDLIDPNCIEEQVNILESDKNSEVGLTSCSRAIINTRGKVVLKRSCPVSSGKYEGSDIIKKCITKGTNLLGEPPAILFRKNLVEKIGLFDADPGYTIDLDYWFRIMLISKIYVQDKTLCSFRISNSSWSSMIALKQAYEYNLFIYKFIDKHNFKINHFNHWQSRLNARLNCLKRVLFFKLFA